MDRALHREQLKTTDEVSLVSSIDQRCSNARKELPKIYKGQDVELESNLDPMLVAKNDGFIPMDEHSVFQDPAQSSRQHHALQIPPLPGDYI